jgi:hypothetical protein
MNTGAPDTWVTRGTCERGQRTATDVQTHRQAPGLRSATIFAQSTRRELIETFGGWLPGIFFVQMS